MYLVRGYLCIYVFLRIQLEVQLSTYHQALLDETVVDPQGKI